MQVGTNGYISFDKVFTDYSPFEYPGNSRVTLVSPFFVDIDTSYGTGKIRYEIHALSQSPALFEDINHIINEQMDAAFAGKWLLLAEWRNCPEFGRSQSIVSFLLNKCTSSALKCVPLKLRATRITLVSSEDRPCQRTVMCEERDHRDCIPMVLAKKQLEGRGDLSPVRSIYRTIRFMLSTFQQSSGSRFRIGDLCSLTLS